MIHARIRNGYVLLLSILVVGTIATAAVTSALLLGTDAQRTAFVVEQSARAATLAEACAEYALHRLRLDLGYGGDEIVGGFLTGETCEVYPVGGAGNTNRIICAEGHAGDAYRRIEMIVQSVFPATTIYSWQEVPMFSLCL